MLSQGIPISSTAAMCDPPAADGVSRKLPMVWVSASAEVQQAAPGPDCVKTPMNLAPGDFTRRVDG